MVTKDRVSGTVSGVIVGDEIELTITDLCAACELSSERVLELVEEGVIEPLGDEPTQWRFRGLSIRRVRRAQRLARDLGVNDAGAALALDLLEELERLRARLRLLEG